MIVNSLLFLLMVNKYKFEMKDFYKIVIEHLTNLNLTGY